MGSKSKSSQSSSSTNNSSSIGIGGDNNGFVVDGDGNSFTTTDHGAVDRSFDFAEHSMSAVENSNNNMALVSAENASVAQSGLNLADSLGAHSMNMAESVATSSLNTGLALAESGFIFANEAIQTNAGLVDSITDMSGLMLDRTLSSAESVFDTTAFMIDNQGDRNMASALAIHDTSISQLEMGNELAFGLASMNNDASLEMQKDNNNALENGFKSMMQFTESFSRSDGADLAKTNMQTVGVLVGGLAITALIFKYKA